MTDPRPRPQYGEYATPEEQAKAMGVGSPASAAASASVDGRADVAAPKRSVGSETSAAQAPTGSPTPTGSTGSPKSTADPAAPAGVRPRRTWDSVLTAVLLGVGAVSVLTSIPQYADFASWIDTGLAQLGYDDYANSELASTVGIALNITQIVLFVAGAVMAILMLRRNRLAFIYPLIAGLVFFVVTFILVAVLFASDPALLDSISSR
ncbi:hypothetical protein B0I08_1029 [Glaciihabitans tibetensis]|uniref:Uncharacterized protein n=1 Tax=Glaciihabitans tibetensis TaxID=1266600 RepID=A0A2T0VGJ7_9MICO|nr:DUF6264 family protein [Glaciihabitans tibetensis]PRY69337.1 hypothetical protein B0I08_1029 [Glaciihabitans tibetensis]